MPVSLVPAGFFAEQTIFHKGRLACSRLVTRWCIRTTALARS
jgi:hypothetical protein